MPKALAAEKNAALKTAAKKVAAKGITKPKHVPKVNPNRCDPKRPDEDHEPEESPSSPFGAFAMGQLGGGGLDAKQSAVVHSNHASNGAGATQVNQENTMTTEAQAAKEAATKAKIAAKAKKLAETAAKKEAAEKAKAEREAAAAAKKAEREAAAAAKKAEREAAANRPPRERTYTGSMLSLADRAASGQYVKGKNGQLRSNDEVAIALEVVPAKQVVGVVLGILGLTANPYAHLNYGQQSMNLRNKLRGAIKAGAKAGEDQDAPVINLARVQEFVAQATEAKATEAQATEAQAAEAQAA